MGRKKKPPTEIVSFRLLASEYRKLGRKPHATARAIVMERLGQMSHKRGAPWVALHSKEST
jgi:hypothetical protein